MGDRKVAPLPQHCVKEEHLILVQLVVVAPLPGICRNNKSCLGARWPRPQRKQNSPVAVQRGRRSIVRGDDLPLQFEAVPRREAVRQAEFEHREGWIDDVDPALLGSRIFLDMSLKVAKVFSATANIGQEKHSRALRCYIQHKAEAFWEFDWRHVHNWYVRCPSMFGIVPSCQARRGIVVLRH